MDYRPNTKTTGLVEKIFDLKVGKVSIGHWKQ